MFVFNAYLFKLLNNRETKDNVPNIGGINCNACVYCMSTLWLSVLVLGVEKYLVSIENLYLGKQQF